VPRWQSQTSLSPGEACTFDSRLPGCAITIAGVAPVVEVEGLRKSYGEVERIHGISFEVEAGEIFGFLGTNGAGKTTTIEILEGYRPRNSGQVSVLGTDPAWADRMWRNRIGLVLQECELDPAHTVRETVSMFARYFQYPTAVVTTIGAVGLTEKIDDRVGHLSGGQKRRLDVALGLIGDPEVLFLDEPTTGLDPAARREMWTMVEGLRDAGKTIFLTTHYMDEAQHLADRIIILAAGEVAAQGTADELSRSLGNRTAITFTPARSACSKIAALMRVLAIPASSSSNTVLSRKPRVWSSFAASAWSVSAGTPATSRSSRAARAVGAAPITR